MNGLEESSTTPTRCHVRVVIIDGCAIVVRPVWSPCSGAGRSGLGPLLGAVTAVKWGVGHGGQQPARTADRQNLHPYDYRHVPRTGAHLSSVPSRRAAANRKPTCGNRGQVMTASSIAGTKRFARADTTATLCVCLGTPLATCALPTVVFTYLLTY